MRLLISERLILTLENRKGEKMIVIEVLIFVVGFSLVLGFGSRSFHKEELEERERDMDNLF